MLSEGYQFIPNRIRRHQSDFFATRLMLQKAICISGEEAAQVFYEPDRFTRRAALPPTTLRLLPDKGSVSMLDGVDHRWRKQLFMSLMTPESINRLTDEMEDQWRGRLPSWEAAGRVVLHDEVQEILCRAVCAWAGVLLPDSDAGQRTREFRAMIDGSGAVGPRMWRGLLLRARTERWIKEVIASVRAGQVDAPIGSAVQVLSSARDHDGDLLDLFEATVELINLLRPTAAVGLFVTFAALALYEHPGSREYAEGGDEKDREAFVHEVRRFYPFFPFIGGRVRNAFDWRDHHFSRGTWVILDAYGTNHDARIWENPDAFRPDRFRH